MQKGEGEHPSSQIPLGHRCARPGLGAERSDGTRLLSFPSECAEEHRVWAGQLHRRVQLHRELAHRVCLNGAPLARSEFRGAAHTRAPQVARSEAKGRSQQGDLLLGTFLRPAIRGRQEKYLARRAKSGQQNSIKQQSLKSINKAEQPAQRAPQTTSQLNPNFCKYLRNRSASLTTARCAREA